MNYLDWNEVNELAVKQKGMWGIYVKNDLSLHDTSDIIVWSVLRNIIESLYVERHEWYFDDISWLSEGGLKLFENEKLARWMFSILDLEQEHYGFYMVLYCPESGCVDESR